jgi:hypothetical protein
LSRAQAVSTLIVLLGLALSFALLVLLPFSFWTSLVISFLVFFCVAGLGHRYFLKRATPEEIRAELEARKSSPG